MKIHLTLNLSCPLAYAVEGLRTVTDEGEELLAALEAAAAVVKVSVFEPDTRARISDETLILVYDAKGSVKATAAATGLARSTVRLRLRRAGIVLPANEVPKAKEGKAAKPGRVVRGRTGR
jgi:transcriptional regulator of acetoin/glycerol metabolism